MCFSLISLLLIQINTKIFRSYALFYGGLKYYLGAFKMGRVTKMVEHVDEKGKICIYGICIHNCCFKKVQRSPIYNIFMILICLEKCLRKVD